jgi:hypothetical protein
LESSHKEEEKPSLIRNTKKSQTRKMRYTGKSLRQEQGSERKSMGTNEELKKDYTDRRSWLSTMRK